jgi:hypothetical protein
MRPNDETVRIKVLSYQNYGGHWYKNGDTIDNVPLSEALDMEALWLAKRIPAEQAPPREIVPTKQIKHKQKDGKKRYEHREMRVDES